MTSCLNSFCSFSKGKRSGSPCSPFTNECYHKATKRQFQITLYFHNLLADGEQIKYGCQNSANVRIFRMFWPEKPRKPGSSLRSCSLIASMAPVPHVPFRELADTKSPTPKYKDSWVPLIILAARLWLCKMAVLISRTALLSSCDKPRFCSIISFISVN